MDNSTYRNPHSAHALTKAEIQQGQQTNTNLYVARLPEWVTDEWLRMQFEKFGMIVSCKVLNEGPTGPRGVGFVQFTHPGMQN